jgi:hypothetical protein
MTWSVTNPEGTFAYPFGDLLALARGCKLGTVRMFPRLIVEREEGQDLYDLVMVRAAMARQGSDPCPLSSARETTDVRPESLNRMIRRVAIDVRNAWSDVRSALEYVDGHGLRRVWLTHELHWSLASHDQTAFVAYLDAGLPRREWTFACPDTLRRGEISRCDRAYAPPTEVFHLFGELHRAGDGARLLGALALGFTTVTGEPLSLILPAGANEPLLVGTTCRTKRSITMTRRIRGAA